MPLPCHLPARPAGLVLAVDRHVLPIGASVHRERGEITADGACTTGVECVKVGPAVLEKLLVQLRSLDGLRHRAAHASPHYGARFITVRWKDGTCQFADSSQLPLDERDRGRFYAAFDGIVAAFLAARPPARSAP